MSKVSEDPTACRNRQTCAKSHIKIHGTSLNVSSRVHVRKVWLHCTYLLKIQEHSTTLHMPASCIEFHPHLTTNVESMDWNTSTYLCKMWLSLHRISQNLQLFNGIACSYAVPNFTETFKINWKLIFKGGN